MRGSRMAPFSMSHSRELPAERLEERAYLRAVLENEATRFHLVKRELRNLLHFIHKSQIRRVKVVPRGRAITCCSAG